MCLLTGFVLQSNCDACALFQLLSTLLQMNDTASPVHISNTLPLSTFDTGQTFPQYVTVNHNFLHVNKSLVLCVLFFLDEEHPGVKYVQQLWVTPSCWSCTVTRVVKLVYTTTTPFVALILDVTQHNILSLRVNIAIHVQNRVLPLSI